MSIDIEKLLKLQDRRGALEDKIKWELLDALTELKRLRASFKGVTIPDGQEPKGAVFELFAASLAVEEDAEASVEALPELDDGPITIRLSTLLNVRKALRRFEVDTEPAD